MTLFVRMNQTVYIAAFVPMGISEQTVSWMRLLRLVTRILAYMGSHVPIWGTGITFVIALTAIVV
jgi:hypothetical protein